MGKSEGAAIETSTELIRWLRLLVLPSWARGVILVTALGVIAGGLGLLVASALRHDAEQASSALALLTVALPVLLIVVALVFGQNSDLRLRELTTAVLRQEIPRAIQDNLGASAGPIEVQVRLRGCCADYALQLRTPGRSIEHRFSVELNVYKVNVCFWIEGLPPHQRVDPAAPGLTAFRHVILGALAEGYRLNEEPARSSGADHGVGLIFFRSLPEEFLLHAGQRLYFVQDLAFFVRGMTEARLAPLPAAVAP